MDDEKTTKKEERKKKEGAVQLTKEQKQKKKKEAEEQKQRDKKEAEERKQREKKEVEERKQREKKEAEERKQKEKEEKTRRKKEKEAAKKQAGKSSSSQSNLMASLPTTWGTFDSPSPPAVTQTPISSYNKSPPNLGRHSIAEQTTNKTSFSNSSPIQSPSSDDTSPLTSPLSLGATLPETAVRTKCDAVTSHCTTSISEETEEKVTTGSREVSPRDDAEKQLDIGLERAAETSRNVGSRSVAKQMSGMAFYKEQSTKYQNLFSSKEKECKELQAKLDQRDMVHEEHVKAKLEDRDKAHQVELDEQQRRFHETLHQKTAADAELTKLKETFEEEQQKTATLCEQLKLANQRINELDKLRETDLKELETRLCEAHTKELSEKLNIFSKAQVKAHDERVDILKEEKRNLQEEIENLKLAAVQQRANIEQEQQEIFDQKLAVQLKKLVDDKEQTIKKLQIDLKEICKNYEELKQLQQQEQSNTEDLEDEIRAEYEQTVKQQIREAVAEESKRQTIAKEEALKELKQQLSKSQDEHQKELTVTLQRHQDEVSTLRDEVNKLQLELDEQKHGEQVAQDQSTPHDSPTQEQTEGQGQLTQQVDDLEKERDALESQLATQRQKATELHYEHEQLKEQYGQLEIQAMAKQQLSSLQQTEGDDNELPFPDKRLLESSECLKDNRTDAEKLRSELEELTRRAELKEQTLQKEVDDLHEETNRLNKEIQDLTGQIKRLSEQLNEVSALNTHLEGVISTALKEAPPSADGIQVGDEGNEKKMLEQIRAKYLEQTVDHQKQIDSLRQRHERNLTALKLQYTKRIHELTDKVSEKDREIQQIRRGSSSYVRPPTSKSTSVESEEGSIDNKSIEDLRAALKAKERDIHSLTVQLRTFQEVALERQQLHQHSKAQSTVVAQLRKDLETAQTELTVLRNKSEFANRMEELHQEVIRLHEELSNLQKEKNAVEDELNIFRNEAKADQTRHEATKHDLARYQSLLATAMREKGAPVGEDKHEMELLKADASLTKIENKELYSKVQRLTKNLTELGKAKLSLERTVTKLKEEQEQLVQENIILKDSKHQEKVELKELDKLRHEAGVTQEHLMQLADTIVSKTDENESLRVKLNELEGELQASKFQAWLYEQDFKEERAAREKAVGTKDDQFGEYRVSIQKLSDRLLEYEVELTRTIKERDNLGKQLQQANNDFERAFASKSDEIKNLREQKAQVSAELDQYKGNFLRCQQQFETDRALHERTRTELQHQIETLKEKAAQTKEELQDKAQLVAVQKLSLEEQLQKITQDHKSKEKQLEILAHEKTMIENELRHTQNNSTVLTDDLAGKAQELSTARQQGERLATELQEARERLETSLADTDRLHDEVMAKTAQVKQYKKQTDSYKTKLDESTAKLLRTQLELQQSKDLVKTMEEENQYQIEEAKARAESDKLAAETDMIKSQRKIEYLERELQAITNEGNIPEAVKVEIGRRLEVEQKLRAAEEKINQLFDKCDSRYHAIEELKQALNKHKIPIPPFAIDKVDPRTPKEQRKVDPGLQQPSSPNRKMCRDHKNDYEQHLLPHQSRHHSSPNPNKALIEPQNSITPGDGQSLPRVQEDGAQPGSEDSHQVPPTSRPELCHKNKMDTGPSMRASDSNAHEYIHVPNSIFEEYQVPKNSQQPLSSDAHEYVNLPKEAGQVPKNPQHQGRQHQQGQQNQPQQQHSAYYSPNQQKGYNQGGWQQAIYHQTPVQRVIPAQSQGYTHSGPDYNQIQSNPPNSPGYQHNYPPVSHAQGNPGPYHQFGVDQSQESTPGVQHQAMLSQQALVRQQPPQHGYVRPQHVVPQQGLVPHQQVPAHPPRGLAHQQQMLVPAAHLSQGIPSSSLQTGRGQQNPQSTPTPLPRRNSGQNLSQTGRPKMASDVQENSLLQGIDQDIKEAANFVIQEGEETELMLPEAPFDPNLICPLCRRNFRKGEIQKYKRHVTSCGQ